MVANGNGAMVVHGVGPTLAKVAVEPTRTFEPGSIEEAYRLSKILVASRLLPRAVGTPEAAFAIIATGRELGLTAMQSLRSIHVIEGKPTLSADLIAALVKSRSDVCKYFRLVESTDQVATYETHRIGEPASTRMSFSWRDAERAGVVGKDNWRKYPAAMLRARAITALARAVYPDLAMGIYDPDEVAPEPRAAEPIPEPTVVPDPSVEGELTLKLLLSRVDASTTVAQLNAVAKDAAKAAKTGLITADAIDVVKGAVTSKRAALAAPKASPSAPEVDPTDDAREAEAEAMAAEYDR